jgi:hypothetical protein
LLGRYFPSQWPKFAATLAGILTGTGQTSPAPPVYGVAEQAVIGIRASDAIFKPNSSEEYLPVLAAQAAVSPSFSDVMYASFWISARWRMVSSCKCNDIDLNTLADFLGLQPAKERYWGNFSTRTKTPILYINGEYDPVTPLENAYNASAGFAGSVVLSHSGYGHGLFASPSKCAANYVQAYFKNATLPPNGTHCEPDLTLLQTWEQAVLSAAATTNSSTNSTTNGTVNGDNGTQNGSAPAYSNAATTFRDSASSLGALGFLALGALFLF